MEIAVKQFAWLTWWRAHPQTFPRPSSLSLAQCPRDLFRPPRTHPSLPRGRACTKTPRKASIFPSLSRLSCQQWLSFVFHCCWDPYTTATMRHRHFAVEKFYFRRVLSYLGKGWWLQNWQTRSVGDSPFLGATRNCLFKTNVGSWRYFKQWVGVRFRLTQGRWILKYVWCSKKGVDKKGYSATAARWTTWRWTSRQGAQQQPRGHETPVRGTAGLGDLLVFKLYVCCVLLQALRDLLCCNIVCEAACCCMLGCIRYRGFCCWVFFSSCVSSWKLCVARWAASDIGALGRSWSPVGPKLPLPCWSRCTSALMLNPTLEMSPQQGLGCRCRKWRRRRYILSFTYIKIESER